MGESARETLRRVFGHDGFRPGQEDAIRAFEQGRDVQVLLPTGGGKSVCYQVPAVRASPSLLLWSTASTSDGSVE